MQICINLVKSKVNLIIERKINQHKLSWSVFKTELGIFT